MEYYASTILKKMLTSEDPGYVDLTSPQALELERLPITMMAMSMRLMKAECLLRWVIQNSDGQNIGEQL